VGEGAKRVTTGFDMTAPLCQSLAGLRQDAEGEAELEYIVPV